MEGVYRPGGLRRGGGGVGTIVLVLGPSTGPAIRDHVEHTWPAVVDVRFATQPAPWHLSDAVLSASDHVGATPYGVGNADDIYGGAARRPTRHPPPDPFRRQRAGRVPPHRCRDRVFAGHPRHLPGRDHGTLIRVDERRQVTRTPEGGFVAGDGREPAILPPDARVSMNLWGFTPAFHRTLKAAMDAATDASEEAEVLLPEVVAESLATSSFSVLPASGRCIGVTHPDDLSLVQAELNRQVAAGERPAKLWDSLP